MAVVVLAVLLAVRLASGIGPATAAGGAAPASAATATATDSPWPASEPVPAPPPTGSPAASDAADLPAAEPSREPSIVPTPRDDPCPARGFDCDFENRFAAVRDYIGTRPGLVEVVVHDRVTGAQWASSDGEHIWAASTIKLAIAVNLLQRNSTGAITLTDGDWSLMELMLTQSDNDATDALSGAYGQSPSVAYSDYGLTNLEVHNDAPGAWGFEKVTASALTGLMDYALSELSPADREWLLHALRGVIAEQQWGVWGAGTAGDPGAKNGWDALDTGWVTNSVGFVGPDERYTVAIMNDLGGEGGFEDGVETVSMVAHLLFAGRF